MNTYIHTLHIQKNKYISKQINTQTHTHTQTYYIHISYILLDNIYIYIYIYTHMSYSCDIQKKQDDLLYQLYHIYHDLFHMTYHMIQKTQIK